MAKLSKTNSFFIFGARGVGKSTLVQHLFKERAHYISLLEETNFRRYSRNADQLISDLSVIDTKTPVVIDEIQKNPALLDTVHHLIETTKRQFVLTGSSARKLKRGAANLLAGRAFQYHLYPLTHIELDQAFNLNFVLQWGSLPKVFSLDDEDRTEFLRSYTQMYLKEEILEEQIVRNGIAFRNYLEITAQENGNCLNFSKIARDVDVDTKTIQSYFQILEDTLVGFFLPAFHQSSRKSVKLQPKFYLFDIGVKRALGRELRSTVEEGTSSYGKAFEHFIIAESVRFNSYFRSDFALFHYQTSAGGEIDLVLKRGQEIIAIEIKSYRSVDPLDANKLSRTAEPLKPSRMLLVSQDNIESKIGNVHCLHWTEFFARIFTASKVTN